ncbi:MAG: hypothetical protein OYH77_00220 [Pseudomonadota bacterium]|nr:hypothetical protein [Pseudomonadota bacterium]
MKFCFKKRFFTQVLQLVVLSCLNAAIMQATNTQAFARSPALTETRVSKRITQRLRNFVAKHADFKKPMAIAMAVWMLNGVPAQASEPTLNITAETVEPTAVAVMTGETEQINANIDNDWEIIKPHRGEKDYTYSVNYLLMEWGDFWRVMQLVYLGKSGKHDLFLGARALIIWQKELFLDQTVNSLVGRNGMIQEEIFDITERKHIPHPERSFYDLTVLEIEGLDMSEYEPIATSSYPAAGTNLEMYSYLVNQANALNAKNYPLGKRTCTAGLYDAKQGFGFNSCLIAATPAIIGSPIFSAKTKRLVAMYAGQEKFGENEVLTAYGTAVPVKLSDLDLEGYAVEANNKVATTWAEIKGFVD